MRVVPGVLFHLFTTELELLSYSNKMAYTVTNGLHVLTLVNEKPTTILTIA